MELDNTPIKYKYIINFSVIAVKIKHVPHCSAEVEPKANWIFSMVCVIFLQEPLESAPSEEQRRATTQLTSEVPECQTRSLGREEDFGWLPEQREKGKQCPQHSFGCKELGGVGIRWICA